jgi:hypothetical protein
MPTTGLILEPCTGDSVNQPVVVKVGYTTDVNFNLNCRVDASNELSPQPHAPTSGTHVSTGISPGAATRTVYGDNATAGTNLDYQSGVIVLGAATAPPVVVGGNSGAMVKGTKKRRPISGTTVVNAVYVVCVVYEVDSTATTRTIIAVGAAMVKVVGGKYKWSVQVNFKVKKPANFQYVARVTAYDATNTSLGSQSKHIKK